jgi:hypothetical protein
MSKYSINSSIRSALRKLWLYSPYRREAMARARISRGVYMCENPDCAKIVGPKDIQVDHIVQATPPGGIQKPEDWGIFIKNLLYCGVEGLHVLCKPCHLQKTNEEKRIESERKKAMK